MHSRLVRCAMSGLVFACTVGVSVAGCLDRPVVPGEPVTKTNFTTKVAEQAVDKIDILFSIDNSASMGDKQAYLEQAIPDLITRLVTPNCVSLTNPNQVLGVSTPDSTGTASCTTIAGSQIEFPAVHDMHIGVVSSSLGPRLGDQFQAPGNGMPGAGAACLPSATITIGGSMLNEHNDDQAHLITRSSTPTTTPPTETPLADAPTGFLAWYPNIAANNAGPVTSGAIAILTPTQLETDFTDLIAGVHEYGCGIESQLESWYRFLIQPDPYASLALDSSSHAQWVGVDTTILKQRHDFLRPDSLVAVIVLTDENDSEIDVRSLGGQGYLFMASTWPPARGTQQCNTNPADPNCQSCDFLSATAQAADSNCKQGAYTSLEDWGFDLNLRHVHMQAKYGITPQFPLTRYVNGLTSAKVPDRTGEYPKGATNYTGTNDCTNPLFAGALPDGTGLSANIATTEAASDITALCNLPASTARPASLVFYAHIGGVPNELLHFDPTSATNSDLTDADWVKILGTDPDTYNYNGIDAHMIESYQPRTAANLPSGLTVAALTPAPSYPTSIPLPTTMASLAAETPPQDPMAAPNADPWNGREWITNVGPHLDLNVDREYACIFPLTQPRDCTNKDNALACDCSSTGLTAPELSPLCDPTLVTNQIAAKAYPTIRELSLAHKLGTQGIVSSICPIDVTDNSAGDDPYYGYRPAVASIVNRLKNALTNQCLPETLTPDSTGAVPCLILATLPTTTPQNKGNPQADCNNAKAGLSQPDPTLLAQFLATAEQEWKASGGVDGGAGPDPQTLPTCEVTQLTGIAAGTSCKGSNTNGWCYVTGAAAGTCAQAIIFTAATPPSGSTINLQCIETNSATSAGTAPTTGDVE